MNAWFSKTIRLLSWTCGVGFTSVIFFLIGYLLYRGADSLSLKLIFGNTGVIDAVLLKKQVLGGLFPAIVGTIILVLLSVGIAMPIGIAAGIHMAEYAQGRWKTSLGFFFDILAAVPSIVIGLFGFSLSLYLHQSFFPKLYPSLIISGLSLAVLVLPYIIRSTQYALESVPASTRIIAPALGATKLQNILYVLIPQASSGIMGGIVLAIGRCAEDTAVIMLTGAVAFAGVSRSLFSGYEALPFYIYYISSQYADPAELATGYAASLILLALCAIFFGISSIIQKGVE
jgi:phosphate transport system permease protein